MNLIASMDVMDREVLETLWPDVLRPSVIERAIALTLEEMSAASEEARRTEADGELARLRAEHVSVTAASGFGETYLERTILGETRRAA